MNEMSIIQQINTIARHKYGSLREACRVKRMDYADIQSEFTSFRYKETPEKLAILHKYLEIIEQ